MYQCIWQRQNLARTGDKIDSCVTDEEGQHLSAIITEWSLWRHITSLWSISCTTAWADYGFITFQLGFSMEDSWFPNIGDSEVVHGDTSSLISSFPIVSIIAVWVNFTCLVLVGCNLRPTRGYCSCCAVYFVSFLFVLGKEANIICKVYILAM